MDEQLLARHRKELRDVEAQVAQKRRAATKKKTRKAVDADCATLLRHVKERHERELRQVLKGDELTGGDATPPTTGEDDDINSNSGTGGNTPPNPNRPAVRQHSQTHHHADNSTPPNAAAASAAPCTTRTSTNTITAATATVEPQEETRLTSSATTAGAGASGADPPRKPNRQKARLARRAAERQADADAAAREAAQLPDRREMERRDMRGALRALGLAEQEIRPDGHCLYSAAAHQLALARLSLWPPSAGAAAEDAATSARPSTTVAHAAAAGGGGGGGDGGESGEKGAGAGTGAEAQADAYKVVRQVVAHHIRRHADQFAPFLEEPLESYTRKIAETAEWGGHLELMAISQAYGVTVKVVQGDGRLETIEPSGSGGEEPGGSAIWLAYYRHQYGLGEHYNSLRPAAAPPHEV